MVTFDVEDCTRAECVEKQQAMKSVKAPGNPDPHDWHAYFKVKTDDLRHVIWIKKIFSPKEP